jgi:hypothetical protein
MSDDLQAPLQVVLFNNPWTDSVPDEELVHVLFSAAAVARGKIEEWQDAGEVQEAQGPFAAVIMDPTRSRAADLLRERILAFILIGEATHLVANAIAKADAHDRHGVPNGLLVNADNNCLADTDFAWGESAVYRRTIGAGSGLSAHQDGELARIILMSSMDDVVDIREAWIADHRDGGKSHGWYNADNSPGFVYDDVVQQVKRRLNSLEAV